MSKLVDRIGTFTTVPNSIIKLWPDIGGDAMQLVLYLRYRTNSETELAFPSYDIIQRDTTLTRRRIAKAIRALEKGHLVERKRRFGGSTLYTLRLPLVTHMDYSSSDAGLSLVQGVHTNKIESNKKDSTIAADAANLLPPRKYGPPQETKPHSREELRTMTANAVAGGAEINASLTSAIETAFHIMPRWDTKTNRAAVERLKNIGATANQVPAVKEAWDKTNGRNGYVPNVSQIVEFWPSAFAEASAPAFTGIVYE